MDPKSEFTAEECSTYVPVPSENRKKVIFSAKAGDKIEKLNQRRRVNALSFSLLLLMTSMAMHETTAEVNRHFNGRAAEVEGLEELLKSIEARHLPQYCKK
jgi:hypothetical protein